MLGIRNTLWKIKNLLFSISGFKTIGARALVLRENKILLVQHTYLSQWYHPGGAVECGETPTQAIIRELAEEVGLKCVALPQLFNVYYNNLEHRDDYIVFYIVSDFVIHNNITEECVRSSEIEKSEWFDIDCLPNTISPATLRRIQEYLNTRPLSENW